MRKLIVTEFMSLDGVVQAPAEADEDTSGGFRHGGWHARFFDEASLKWVLDNVTNAGGYVLGRRTCAVLGAPRVLANPAIGRKLAAPAG